jgi:hypothetical protein
MGDTGMRAGGQDSFEPAHAPGAGDAPLDQRIFGRIPGPIKTEFTMGAQARYPALQVADLMAATSPPLRYLAIKISPTVERALTCSVWGPATKPGVPTSTQSPRSL